MAFRSLADLMGATTPVPASTTQPVGHPDAECRFSPFGEDATAENFNRPHYALGENTDQLRAWINRDLAEPSLEDVVVGAPTNTIVVSTASAGIYVGGAGYSDDQQNRDLLVKITDTNGDEIVIDSEEVKCSDINRSDTHVDIIGNGFWTATDVEFIFNKTLPAATYRLNIGRRTDIENISEDALLSATIRGSHEAASEFTYKSAYVCAVDTTYGPADFVGTDAIQRALAEAANSGKRVIFVRNGSYTLEEVGGGALDIGEHGVTVIGESEADTDLNLNASEDLTLNGVRITLSNLTINGDESQTLRLAGNYAKLERVTLKNISAKVTGYMVSFHRVSHQFTSSVANLILGGGGYQFRADNCSWNVSSASAIEVGGDAFEAGSAVFESCEIKDYSSVSTAPLIKIKATDSLSINNGHVLFSNCEIHGSDAGAIEYGSATYFSSVSFEGCTITSRPNVSSPSHRGVIRPLVVDTPQFVQLAFRDCVIQTRLSDSALYEGPFIQLMAARTLGEDAPETARVPFGNIVVEHCTFNDFRAKGVDETTDPPSQVSGGTTTETPIMNLYGVVGKNIIFDRTGLVYDIQHAPWVHTEFCDIDGLEILYPDIETNGGRCHDLDTNASVAHEALIDVGQGSVIKNIRVVGWPGSGSTVAGGEWLRPLVLISGDFQTEYPAAVDGLEIWQYLEPSQSSPYEWRFNSTEMGLKGLVQVGYSSRLSRFYWNSSVVTPRNRNKLSTNASYDLGSLLYSTTGPAIIENSFINLVFAGGTFGGYLVRSTSNQLTFRNNDVNIAGPTAIGISQMIRLQGTGHVIRDNDLSCSSDDPSSGFINVSVTDSHSLIQGNKISANNTATYNAIVVQDDENAVVGNVILGDTAAPDISPNTVTGYSTNVLTF